MSFENFAGNNHLKTQISRFIETNKILNSYVFSGENGIGKKTLSMLFVKRILCEAPISSGACGVCPSCKQINSKNHPDVFYLTKQKDKKTLGIEEIREQIIKQVYIKPFIAQKKVFIINDGDDLTTEAQNGLLKVLEEPPSYVTFIILVTKQSMLLDTVLSRSCVLNLHPAPKEDVISYLKNNFPDKTDSEIEFSAKFSQGIIGKAVKILNDEDYKALFFEISRQMANVMSEKKALVNFHRFLIDNKENIETIIEFMLIYLRDALLVCEGLHDMAVCTENFKNSELNIKNKKMYVHSIDSVIAYKSALMTNVNFTILSLDFLLEIQKNCNIN